MATATEPRKSELVKQSPFSAPINFDVSMEQIDQLRREYMPLAIIDVNDKAQVAKVHDARMDVTRLITGIEKGGKAMRDEANKFAKNVIAAERMFTNPLIEIQNHLKDEEGKVKREAERIAREAEEKRQATIRERLRLLQACGKAYMSEDVATLPQDEFDALLAAEQAEKKARDEELAIMAAERERIAAEQKAEADRLAKERAEFEAKQREAETRNKCAMARMQLLANAGYAHAFTGDDLADMEPRQWEITLGKAREEKAANDKARSDERAALEKQRAEQEAERDRISKERQAIYQSRVAALREYPCPGIDRGIVVVSIDSTDEEFQAVLAKAKAYQREYDAKQAAELEKAKAEAAEKARLEAIAEQERKAAAEKELAATVEAEQQRREELRPDREKIAIFADSIASMAGPKLSVKAREASVEIGHALVVCSKAIRAAGSKLK